jgi:hypothetical protein
MANAIDLTLAVKFLNATLPVGTAGIPGTAFGTLASSGMYIRLDSTAPTGTAAGTQLANGNGYTTNGLQLANASTPAAGTTATVTLPAVAQTWTNTSGGWTINGLDITDSSQVRTWYGTFTGAPITVAASNSFQIAVNAITVTLS